MHFLRSRAILLSLLFLVVAAACALADRLVFRGVGHFFSPLLAGLLSFFYLQRFRNWFAIIPGAFAYLALSGLSPLLAFGVTLIDLLGTALMAALLLSAGRRLYRIPQIVRLLLVAVVGSAATAGLIQLLDHSLFPWLNWLERACADLLGVLVILPLVQCFERAEIVLRRRPKQLIAMLFAVALLVLLRDILGVDLSRLHFLFFPLMALVAMHYGQGGVALVGLVISLFIGASHIQLQSTELLDQQGFLITILAMGLFLAAVRTEAGIARDELQGEQFKLHNVLDALPTSIFLEDQQGRFSYANKAFLALAERDLAGLVGQSVNGVCGRLGLEDTKRSESAFKWQTENLGQRRTFLCRQFPLHDQHGRAYGQGLAATDITDQLAAEEQLRLANQVFENATEGILMTDAQARIIAVNPAFTKITGYEADEAIGKVSRMFWSDERADSLVHEISSHLERDGYWQGEMLDRRKTGEFYPAWLSISGVRNPEGLVTHYVGVFSDFTVRKETESRLQFLAERDSLTQLFNRTALQKKLEEAVIQASEAREELALFFIDLDRFKYINDTKGHAVGDELLQVIALRLRHCLKQNDMIARLGGDEFTVLIARPPEQAVLAEIAQRVAFELSRPCIVRGHEIAVTCSIGIGRYPQDCQDSAELMRTADVAMYRAKEIGKNTYQFYGSDLQQRTSENSRLEASLRTAIREDQFVLHYQPQFDLQSEKLTGFEALVRWEHPELGMIPPSSFIPLAEASGLIVPLGEWVLRAACRQLVKWRASGYDAPRVSVNLSAQQVTRGELLPLTRGILAETGIEPFRLELEITESMLMENQKEAVTTLASLRALGIRIAVDDFGTGYSSLANLKDYPVDCIKIDRHFVEHVPDDDDSNAIIEAIVALARRLQLQIVVEGVETEMQANFLRHVGCEIGQGYFYGRPQPATYYPDVWKTSPTSFEV